jgi:hypothetical protein
MRQELILNICSWTLGDVDVGWSMAIVDYRLCHGQSVSFQ